MSDKTSQRTEEEMLDQTFVGYDQEMTVETESPETVENTKPAGEGKKKMSSTKMLIGGGAAAVVVVGAIMFLGKSSNPNSQPAPTPMAANNTTNNVNNTPAPVVNTPNTAPVAQTTPDAPVLANTPVQNQGGNNSNDPAANFLAGQANGINSLVNKPVDNNTVNSNSNGNNNVVTTPVVNNGMNAANAVNSLPVQQVVNAPIVTDPTVNNVPLNTGTSPTVGNNVVQQTLVDQLKVMFEQQTKEIKSSVEQVGNRVTDIEKDIASQKEATKSLEERIAKLEAGKSTKVASNSTSNSSETAKAKKVYHKHVIVKREPTSETTEIINNRNIKDNGRDVLIDKSSDKVNSYGDVQIHSIYAGRVWTKNKDGSLSTFSAGDRLPSGEVIKRIDDDKGQIITDKRVIK